MRRSAVVLLVLGTILAFVSAYIIFANPDLDAPLSNLAAPTWIPLYDLLGWRLVVGGWALSASVLIAAGSLAARDYPRVAWLSLLLYVLAAPVIVVSLSLAPSFALAFVALVVSLVVAPLATIGIAAAISRAVRRGPDSPVPA